MLALECPRRHFEFQWINACGILVMANHSSFSCVENNKVFLQVLGKRMYSCNFWWWAQNRHRYFVSSIWPDVVTNFDNDVVLCSTSTTHIRINVFVNGLLIFKYVKCLPRNWTWFFLWKCRMLSVNTNVSYSNKNLRTLYYYI